MYKTLLHATDLKENHYQICEQAVAFAKEIKAKLYLLHVIEPPAFLQLAQGLGFAEIIKPVKDEAIEVLNILGEAFDIDKSYLHVEIGSVKQQISNKVKMLGCDLVIIGSHETENMPSILGSTAYSIINNTPCAVLTLK